MTVHVKAKAEFERLFPNSVTEHVPEGHEPEPDLVIYVEATDDFEVTDDTETTTKQFQEQYANFYAMGFRLVIG